MAFRDWLPGALWDFSVLVVVFLQWLILSLAIDAAGGEHGARKAVTMYLGLSSLAVCTYQLYTSFQWIGKPTAPPESLIGLFYEIVNLTQGFGTMFCAARTWSLPTDNTFHDNTLLHQNADSIFEMGLVQAGVGWASAFPITFSERLVAWMAAYIGGVFAMNMFLISVVLTKRGYWEREDYLAVPTSARAGEWSVSLK
jgi:hypothetical protein